MTARLWIRMALAISLIALGCSKRGGQPGRIGLVPLSLMTEQQKLMLFEHVPLGSTLSDVRRTAPDLGRLRAIGLPAPGLTAADVSLEVLGHRTRAEFNFRNDTLYSVNFGPLVLPADSGDAMFAELNEFYTRRLGAPRVGDGQDSPYFVKSRTWQTPRAEIGTANSLNDGQRILGWGYQPPNK